MLIPRIIHQLWIGDKKLAPTKLLETWKKKHPGFEYIFWDENELERRNFIPQLYEKINEMEEINGKADILRWEILYKYGGVFIDADSICIEPIDELLKFDKSFASYENEVVRGSNWTKGNPDYDDVLGRMHPLIATGTMAFPPNHLLPKLAIEWIEKNEISIQKTGKRAWRTVGPGLLTRLYYSQKWNDMIIFPSHYFLPVHGTGFTYYGHGKVYAHQEWGSTKQTYESINSIDIDKIFVPPKVSVSVLIPSYNTKYVYIKECLDSIRDQEGLFHIEIVWINDGSDALHTTLLKKALEHFKMNTRYTSVVYHENAQNLGVGTSLNTGVLLCSNDIIFRMDSDDIMIKERIHTQLLYMSNNPNVHICGCQIAMFRDKPTNIVSVTHHLTMTWDEYKKNPSHWFLNGPTVCFRKESVLRAGNYNKDLRMAEDFDLWLRMLQRFGVIYNFKEPLLYYRLHNDQLTQKNRKDNAHWMKIRNQLIEKIIPSV